MKLQRGIMGHFSGAAMAAALLLLLAGGCSDDSTPTSDASIDTVDSSGIQDGTDDEGITPDLPLTDAAHDVAPSDIILTSDMNATWVGGPCATAADCENGAEDATCLQGGEWVWLGGYCSTGCLVVENVDPCPTGSHCEELAQTGENPFVCIKNCYVPADCRTGYTCAPMLGTDYGACIVF